MADESNTQWWSYTITAVGTAVVSVTGGVIGTYYFLRSKHLKVKGDEAEQRRIEDANTTRAWRELVDYKSDDFRKKNEEQDKRMAAMLIKMDLMHSAHLKCERDAMEREMEYRRGAIEKEIVLKQHESVIKNLSLEVESLTAKVSMLILQQDMAKNKIKTDAMEAAITLKEEAKIEAATIKTEALIEAAKVKNDAKDEAEKLSGS